ncbi:hypothetical protein HY214_02220 [Candidatus Roizmanbacteria bacterium]|nr:hypothetical protein [Candidatus Roizmanbacteria bacterium]
MSKVHKWLTVVIFLIILVFFCYFRIKALYLQTVGYTFDQGRDFLKVAEIVLYRNLTFIGPTTGIMGLYHGAWWYYFLLLPFVVFNGNPIGFYYFNFLLHLGSLVLLAYVTKKYFGVLTALTVTSLIALSPYFIFTSLFVGNNIMVLPVFLGFLIGAFLMLEKKKRSPVVAIITGLCLGLVAELEVAFGLFLLPSFFITLLFYRPLRAAFGTRKNFLFFLLGLFIPFVPRLLFESKHHFQQTLILLSFFLKPQLHNSKQFSAIVWERLHLFQGYFTGIFAHDRLVWFALLAVLFASVLILRTRSRIYSKSLIFFALLTGLLFIFSTFYKDNFWGNYYEGIQYLFIFMLAILLSPVVRKVRPATNFSTVALSFLLGANLTLGSYKLLTDLPKKPKEENLKSMISIVSYVQKNTLSTPYCVRVYTPPVIPYTYQYLFLHNSISGQRMPQPQEDWVNKTCWFILENDSYKERRDRWITANIPVNAIVKKSRLFNDTLVELVTLP